MTKSLALALSLLAVAGPVLAAEDTPPPPRTEADRFQAEQQQARQPELTRPPPPRPSAQPEGGASGAIDTGPSGLGSSSATTGTPPSGDSQPPPPTRAPAER